MHEQIYFQSSMKRERLKMRIVLSARLRSSSNENESIWWNDMHSWSRILILLEQVLLCPMTSLMSKGLLASRLPITLIDFVFSSVLSFSFRRFFTSRSSSVALVVRCWNCNVTFIFHLFTSFSRSSFIAFHWRKISMKIFQLMRMGDLPKNDLPIMVDLSGDCLTNWRSERQCLLRLRACI